MPSRGGAADGTDREGDDSRPERLPALRAEATGRGRVTIEAFSPRPP